MEKAEQQSPTPSPPPTDFPCPEPKRSKLPLAPSPSHPPAPGPKSTRPATDQTRSVSHRGPWLDLRRSTTVGDTVRTPSNSSNASRRRSASSSDISSSDGEALTRGWSLPDHRNTHMSHLNRVHRHDHSRISRKERPRGRLAEHGDRPSTAQDEQDGRLPITVDEIGNISHLARALGLKRQHHLRPLRKPRERHDTGLPATRPGATVSKGRIPRMNIVIMVIGSRGDVQPFLKIGRVLKEKYGHRVRIATHPVFREFVQRDSGLEFFSVGGDPSELMAFMVKNPGLIPSLQTLRDGEIGRRRESMYEMFQGFWRACVNATDEEKDMANLEMMDDRYPFIADAVIANPPSFAHVHCAERLGIPLHLVFTFPYTPTQQFPHPLANISVDEADTGYTNLMSYPLVELMTWQGLGDLVNHFRVKTLGLEPMSTLWAPGQLFRLKVPYTYLWSPGLVPKPADWGPEIDVAGYVFLDLASDYQPAAELLAFLAAGEEPVYIGFGSISGVKDPDAFTKMVFGAVEKANVRAIISKGWGDMGKGVLIPDSVLLVDNVPHDWLFPRVRAVVHHGGAGTTAIGLKCGKPTMIVPFFGDQPFWGAMVARAHAGAQHCFPLKKLTVDSFANGIRQCLTTEARQSAEEIAKRIAEEGDGADNAVDSFHRALPLDGERSLRCFVFPDRVAVWRYKRSQLHLSALAAGLLVQKERLHWCELRLLRHYDWDDFQGPGEPITGAGATAISGFREIFAGLSNISHRTRKGLKLREKQKRRQQRRTVASAIAIPGHVAQQRFRPTTSPGEQVEPDRRSVDEVNLHGSAAPPAGRWRHVVARSSTSELDQLPGEVPAPGQVQASKIPDPPQAVTIILRAGLQGLAHSGKVFIRLPFDVQYAVTLGFHNAPRLYGDGSVRPPSSPITGFRSGLQVAGIEFAYGFWDGLVGLVRLPRHDMQDGEALGFFKGLAKGMGGLVMKPASGLVGLAGYTGKGIEVGVRKRVRDTGKTDRWIRRAHSNQGEKDLRKLRDMEGGPSDGEGEGGGEDDPVEKATAHALRVWSTQQQQEEEEEEEEAQLAAQRREHRDHQIPHGKRSRRRRSERKGIGDEKSG